MQSQLLRFVIDKCLEMDVEINILDGGEVALENGTSKDDSVFMLEMDEAPQKARNLPAGNGATVIDTVDKVRGHSFLGGDYLWQVVLSNNSHEGAGYISFAAFSWIL